MKQNLLVRQEGELKTPWDKYYNPSLIRESPCKTDAPYVLEFGVNYFILKLESLGLKTMWSCEGHPSGFYIVFKAPYKIAREISYASIGCCAELSISNTLKPGGHKNPNNRKSWRDGCWNLHLMPHGNSFECRNMILRELSINWEKQL